MKILLTGFGPFGEVIRNPTERLVRHFERRGCSGHDLTTLVLPVAYRVAPAMVAQAIDQGEASGAPFDLVWMLGVAASSTAWRVERRGQNLNGGGADAEGVSPSVMIVPNGPPTLAATVPVDQLVSDLNGSGLHAIESLSAGDYLCNHVFYRTLWHLGQKECGTLAGFLHVPPDYETFERRGVGSCVTFADQVRAAEVTLSTLTRSA